MTEAFQKSVDRILKKNYEINKALYEYDLKAKKGTSLS
jgi:hypothetical protein